MFKPLAKKKKGNKTKSTYAQSFSALRGRTEEYFWMTSTVGAPLCTLLSLRLSKAGRRRGSYQSCVISSQLTGLPSHKKVRTRVHGRCAGLLGQAASKPGAAGRRSESHLAVWGQEQPVCLDFFDELQGKDSDARWGCDCINGPLQNLPKVLGEIKRIPSVERAGRLVKSSSTLPALNKVCLFTSFCKWVSGCTCQFASFDLLRKQSLHAATEAPRGTQRGNSEA